MASFEPFVSSDPFSMSTFNTKLGGAFGKVDADVSALQTAAAGFGNCSIETQSYTGTGTYGASNPNSLTFTKKPKTVLIFGQYFFLLLTDKSISPAPTLVYYNTSDRTVWQSVNYTWSGNTLQ